MTKLELTTELLNIVEGLLEAGITACNIHEARIQLDYLFDDFEEDEIIDCELEEDEAMDHEHCQDSLIGFSKEELGQCDDQRVNITTFFSDLSETVFNDDGMFLATDILATNSSAENSSAEKRESEDTDVMSLDEILDGIIARNEKLPKHLKQYFHTIENIEEDGYVMFLDGSDEKDEHGENNENNEKIESEVTFNVHTRHI